MPKDLKNPGFDLLAILAILADKGEEDGVTFESVHVEFDGLSEKAVYAKLRHLIQHGMVETSRIWEALVHKKLYKLSDRGKRYVEEFRVVQLMDNPPPPFAKFK